MTRMRQAVWPNESQDSESLTIKLSNFTQKIYLRLSHSVEN